MTGALKMRMLIATMVTAVALGPWPVGTAQAQVQTASRATQAEPGSDLSAQRRPRARVRIYRNDDERGVYPRYNPGPNAVRDCTASLVQEFRPSGTVIVPRMNCFWRRG